MAGLITADEAVASSETSLIERAQQGDTVAYDELIQPRLPRLLRIALSTLGNEADARDVVQETCLRAWRELPRLRDRDRFDAWLGRIVVNGCRNALRSRRRSSVRQISSDALTDQNELPDPRRAVADDLSANDTIRRAFARLDADRRLILVLHHIDGRPVSEIAGLLGIPEGTAKWRLHAARAALERALELEGR